MDHAFTTSLNIKPEISAHTLNASQYGICRFRNVKMFFHHMFGSGFFLIISDA
jgi:hypothetical protein